MPGGDGMGPDGLGPYGRGLGPCGLGLGRRLRRGFGRGFGRGLVQGFSAPADLSKEDQIKILEAEKAEIEAEQKLINEKLEKLK